MTPYDSDCRYVSKWCLIILVALAGLLAWFASAQPVITRLEYKVCPPIQDGVAYAPGDSSLYADYNDATNNESLSGSVYLGAIAQVTLTWTGAVNRSYAVESTPLLGDWRAPFVRVSPWLSNSAQSSLVWTQAFVEEQRFVRIVER